MSSAVEVTEATFEADVLKSSVPVIVDFWATWCGPCQQIAPVLDEIAAEYEGKAKVVKVNVDDDRTLAMKYGIMSIPNLKFFKDGEVKTEVVGTVPGVKSVIASKLDALL